MEVLGILVGLSVASQLSILEVRIISDCQSAVKRLHKLQYCSAPLRTKTRDASLLASSIAHWNHVEGVDISWTPGHPEKEQTDASLWTREMWGNHLSDRAAAGVLNSTNAYQYKNSDFFFLTLSHLWMQLLLPLFLPLQTYGSLEIGRTADLTLYHGSHSPAAS